MMKFSANLSMLFTEAPFLERFNLAHDAGFSGVEYLFPYDYPAEILEKKLSQYELQQVLFNLPAGNWQAGERGIACHPDRIEEFRNGIDQAIHYAKALRCNRLNCLAGIQPKYLPIELCQSTLVENLRYAAEKLAAENITLMVEAINTVDIPGFYLNNSRQAAELIKDVSHPNIHFQYDIYHMQIMEGNICQTIETHYEIIKHIQLADNPGRHEPGTGEINYDYIFNFLSTLGYQGWIGCEYIPQDNTLSSLKWMKNYLN